MMEQCQKCLFYSKEYNEARQSWNDIIFVGQEEKEEHYCGTFQPIPREYVADETKCPAFVKK